MNERASTASVFGGGCAAWGAVQMFNNRGQPRRRHRRRRHARRAALEGVGELPSMGFFGVTQSVL